MIPASSCWNDETSSEIIKLAKKIAETTEPQLVGKQHILFKDLNSDAAALIDRIVPRGTVDRDRCIYVFELDADSSASDVRSIFKAVRSDKTRKLPQLNSGESDTIYVGSSCATGNRSETLRSRLRQHLTTAPKGTYALRLGEWTAGLSGGIHLSAWQYPKVSAGEEGDRLARQTVLAVEDWLSQRLSPMFGRRGSRN